MNSLVCTNRRSFLKQIGLAGLSAPNPWQAFGPDLIRCARTGFDLKQMRQTLVENLRQCAARLV